MWGLRRMWEVEESPGGSSLETGVRKRLSSVSSAVLGPCQKHVVDLWCPSAGTVYCQPVVCRCVSETADFKG